MVLHRGPRPYGYFGFGELFVLSTSALWRRSAPPTSNTSPCRIGRVVGVATGFMACALLEANNLRDVEGDRSSGKKTLAARMNRGHAPWLFATCVLGVLVAIAGAGHVVVASWRSCSTFLRSAWRSRTRTDESSCRC